MMMDIRKLKEDSTYCVFIPKDWSGSQVEEIDKYLTEHKIKHFFLQEDTEIQYIDMDATYLVTFPSSMSIKEIVDIDNYLCDIKLKHIIGYNNVTIKGTDVVKYILNVMEDHGITLDDLKKANEES